MRKEFFGDDRDVELRLKCLSLANGQDEHQLRYSMEAVKTMTTKEIVGRAKEFYDFVKGK